MPADTHPPLARAWTVWGLGAALYLIGFFHRVAPAVLTNELTAQFSLTAVQLGNLSAVYFYSYVAMQIPTGLAADHWGPRRILTLGAALAAAGTLLFAIAHAFPLVVLGRLLIGASVAVAFVSMLKLSTHWFEPSRFAALAGIAVAVGVVGAVSAGAPLRFAADAFGWRAAMVAAAIVTAFIAVGIWLVVRDDPRDIGMRSFIPQRSRSHAAHSVIGGLRACLGLRNTRLAFVINGAIAGCPLTFAGLWGVPFLATHYSLSTAAAAGLCSLVLVAWAVAGPVIGALSDRLGRRKPVYVAGAVATLAAWTVIVQVPQLPIALLAILLIVAGGASGCMLMGFSLAKELAPQSLAGTVGGIVNMGNMLGSMLLQPIIGWVLDRSWTGTLANGVRIYGFDAYRSGFSLMLAWLALALVLAAFMRESYCRQQA